MNDSGPRGAGRLKLALSRAAETGNSDEIEAALGAIKGDADRVEAAKAAAAAALKAERWDNLAYLADFLADVTAAHPPTGGSDDEGAGDGPPEGGSPPEDLGEIRAGRARIGDYVTDVDSLPVVLGDFVVQAEPEPEPEPQ